VGQLIAATGVLLKSTPLSNYTSIVLVGNQIDTHFFSMICLFESSTCFEPLCAHPQEDNCINAASGIITVLVAIRYAGQDGTHVLS
jgi:hypothetical protein